VEKAPDAFRTISEVAADLNVPQHVLRFWESRFSEIKPMKRGGGRRYYRPDDVDLLRGIRHLLYGEGYTIRGVQRILKDQGLRYVQTIWQPGAAAAAAVDSDDVDFAGEESEPPEQQPGRERGRRLFGLLPSLLGNANDVPVGKGAEEQAEEDEEEADEEAEADEEDADDSDSEEDSDEDAEDEDSDYDEDEEDSDDEADEDEKDGDEDNDDDEEDGDEDNDDDEEEEEDKKPSRSKPAPTPLTLRRPSPPVGGSLRAAVSFEDMRRLESALDDLAECKRLLDATLDEKV
jgi:DNA-binding transcriptional MerR regulator